MPGATPVQGFPYPFEKEGATPVSAQNLATEVDVELANADAQQLLVLRRPSARVTRASGSQAVTINVVTLLTYDTAEWDTGTFYSAGTPNRLTVPPVGIYAIAGSYEVLAAPETDTVYEIHFQVGGSSVALHKIKQYGVDGDIDDRSVSAAFLYRMTAGQFVDMRCFWTGTAGTSRNIAKATLSIRFVAPA